MNYMTRQCTLCFLKGRIHFPLYTMFHYDFFICQLSYFTRKYRPTVSARSSVHVCAPHNFHEKWYIYIHTHTHSGPKVSIQYIVIYNIITVYLLLAHLHIYTYTHHATVNDTPYLYIFNLFIYSFN